MENKREMFLAMISQSNHKIIGWIDFPNIIYMYKIKEYIISEDKRKNLKNLNYESNVFQTITSFGYQVIYENDGIYVFSNNKETSDSKMVHDTFITRVDVLGETNSKALYSLDMFYTYKCLDVQSAAFSLVKMKHSNETF